jgi:hypothetical protein
MKKKCRRKVYQLVDCVAHAIAGAGITTDDCLDQLKAKETAAIEAMRFEATGRMLMTGTGLKAIQEVSEWHHLQRKSISRAEYERMIEKTRNKIRSRSKDVTVIQ